MSIFGKKFMNSLIWGYWNQVKENENMWHGFQDWSKKLYEKLGQKILDFELLTVKNPPGREHRMKKAIKDQKISLINRKKEKTRRWRW